MPIKLVIDNSKSDELAMPVECDKSNFIQAALHAAQHSNSSARANILKDVSEMLSCRAEDLSFLFHLSSDKNDALVYKLDLPDYRLQNSEFYLEAAE